MQQNSKLQRCLGHDQRADQHWGQRWFSLGALLVFSLLFSPPVALAGPCAVVNGSTSMSGVACTSIGPMTPGYCNVGISNAGGADTCVLTSINDVFHCAYGTMTGATFMIPASNASWVVMGGIANGTMAICQWQCCTNNLTVTMDTSNGLPVELMDFAIDVGGSEKE